MATEVLTELATKLYEVVQTVKGNIERCKQVNARAQRLVPALERIRASPAKNDVSEVSSLLLLRVAHISLFLSSYY